MSAGSHGALALAALRLPQNGSLPAFQTQLGATGARRDHGNKQLTRWLQRGKVHTLASRQPARAVPERGQPGQDTGPLAAAVRTRDFGLPAERRCCSFPALSGGKLGGELCVRRIASSWVLPGAQGHSDLDWRVLSEEHSGLGQGGNVIFKVLWRCNHITTQSPLPVHDSVAFSTLTGTWGLLQSPFLDLCISSEETPAICSLPAPTCLPTPAPTPKERPTTARLCGGPCSANLTRTASYMTCGPLREHVLGPSVSKREPAPGPSHRREKLRDERGPPCASPCRGADPRAASASRE